MNTLVVKKVDCMKRIDTATVPKSMSQEQENVIKKLEEALNILRRIHVKNEDSFTIINEPLDEFLSNLKYLPTDPSFDIIPTEIKTDIFSYLCDSGAFVAASVCLEWKDVMATRLKKVEEVKIGVHCTNKYECEDMECFMPEEVLKASIALQSDVPLSLCYPLPDVDSKLIAEGLASASSLSIKGECDCRGAAEDDEDGDDADEPVLTRQQVKELFDALDQKTDVMKSLSLLHLDLTWLNKKRLTDFLISVTRSLTLDEGEFGTMFNVTKFVQKLSQTSEDSHELHSLRLHNFEVSLDDSSAASAREMADALCNVFTVELCPEFFYEKTMVKRLIKNILTRPVAIKILGIYQPIDWRTLIKPQDLITLLDKMWLVKLGGTFTPAQVEAVRSLPGVEASLNIIYKVVQFDEVK